MTVRIGDLQYDLSDSSAIDTLSVGKRQKGSKKKARSSSKPKQATSARNIEENPSNVPMKLPSKISSKRVPKTHRAVKPPAFPVKASQITIIKELDEESNDTGTQPARK